MKTLLVLILLALAGVADAANYTTQRFLVDYTVRKDRLVEVTESIDVTFTAAQHGFIRRIPLRVRGAKKGTLREVAYTLGGVEADFGSGFHKEPATAAEDNGDWKIRIGDPDIEHSGPSRYRIHYTIRGALTDVAQGEGMGPRTELNWNLIPAHWATAIDHAGGTIKFPAPTQGDLAARLLIGTAGSQHGVEVHRSGKKIGSNPALTASFAGDTELTFTVTTPIEQGVGVTVVLGLPKGTVDQAPPGPEVPIAGANQEPSGSPIDRVGEIPNNPLGYLIPLIVVPIVYLLAKPRFAPPTGPLTVRFEPPDGVGASECGLLVDHSVDQQDVVAGIVALAQKGAARMHHAVDGAGGLTVELLSVENGKGLTPFEEQLYGALATFGPVITPEILRGNFHPYYSGLVQALLDESVSNGWYSSKSNSTAGCGCLLALLLGAATLVLFPFLGFPVVIGAIAAFVVSQVIVSKTSNLLPLGAKLRGQCLGLREFITRAHQKELNYMADRMPDQALYEDLLPYAVAFNAVQQWTKAFDGINLQPPEWYSGYDGTDMLWTYLLMNDLMYAQNDYGQAVSYAPPTTSYGSGGGFGDNDSGFGGGFSGGSDSGSTWDSGGSFDSGGSVDSGGGGGGGDSW